MCTKMSKLDHCLQETDRERQWTNNCNAIALMEWSQCTAGPL